MTKAPLFQVLDTKADCVGYFTDNMINANAVLPWEGQTWEYSIHLPGEHYDLGRIYSNGATLTDVCPDDLKEEWETIKSRLRACIKAFRKAHLSLDQNCFYDVVPEYFLFLYLTMKNRITRHVLDTYSRPANYDSMYNLVQLLASIRSRSLAIDTAPIQHLLSSVRGKNFLRTLQTIKPVCDYNAWGTVTGRLATNPHSFPILTMNKEFRSCVQPHNDWFLELDFNAAELRVLLALGGASQPSNDIHAWNLKNIYGGTGTREDAKKRIFAWMYNPQSTDDVSSGSYDKKLVKSKYWDGYKVKTDYGRILENVDDHHALNYIVQSTTIDTVHEQACRVYELLKGRKSYISFLIHDAVYIDLADEDRYEILNLLDTFGKTRYGRFKVNVSAGKNLGQMKRLKL